MVPIDASAGHGILNCTKDANRNQVLTLTAKCQRVITIVSFGTPLARHSAFTSQPSLQVVLVYPAAVVRHSNSPSARVDPAIDVRCFCVDGVVDELRKDGGEGGEGDGGLYKLRDAQGELSDGFHGGSRSQWQAYTACTA